jgi:hypothetical protein
LIGEHEPIFILTILPETGILRFEHIETEEELAFRIRQLLDSGEEVSISVSFGFRLQISKPPLRYLVAPWGKTPLFDPLPQELQLEDDGYIGKRYEAPGAETESPEEELPAAAANDEEEAEPQTVDDTASIFASTDFQDDEDG